MRFRTVQGNATGCVFTLYSLVSTHDSVTVEGPWRHILSNARAILRRARQEQRAAERLAPRFRDGYLYYIRLKTQLGTFYKLGFTKSSSVESRFSYGGSGDYELIDKELLFVYLDDAYDVETRLHRHFSNKKSFGTFSSVPDMPLYKSGQGELYYKDVLKIDENYSSFRRWKAFLKVMQHQGRKEFGNPVFSVLAIAAVAVFALLFCCIVLPFSWAAEWINNQDPKWENLEKKRVESVKSYEKDIVVLVASLQQKEREQKGRDLSHRKSA